MRVFVAVEISNDQVINSIMKFQSMIKIKAKPIFSQNLHFTIQFLGEISQDEVKKVRQALMLLKFKNFKINFKGVGAFPNLKNPRIIWIGTDEGSSNNLKDLAVKVEKLLSPLGFKSDKLFKSHVTVFRIKNKVNGMENEFEKFAFMEFGSQSISEIKLKQSNLTPQGPIYSDIEVIKAI